MIKKLVRQWYARGCWVSLKCGPVTQKASDCVRILFVKMLANCTVIDGLL